MRIIPVLVLMLLVSGCGKKEVTLRLRMAMPPAEQKNTDLLAGTPVGFCSQPSLRAGVILEPHTPNERVLDTQPIPLRTNFANWTGTAPTGLAEIMAFLQPSQLQFPGEISLRVLQGIPLAIGMVGKLLLGVNSGSTICGAGSTLPDWNYVGAAGSIDIIANSDMSVAVPVTIARKVITTAYTGAQEGSSSDLTVPGGRSHFLALHFQMPSNGTLTSYTSANVILSPDRSTDPNKKIYYPLVPQSSPITNSAPIITGMELPANNATQAFMIPRVFPIEVVIKNSNVNCSVYFNTESAVKKYWATPNQTVEPALETLEIAEGDWSCI